MICLVAQLYFILLLCFSQPTYVFLESWVAASNVSSPVTAPPTLDQATKQHFPEAADLEIKPMSEATDPGLSVLVDEEKASKWQFVESPSSKSTTKFADTHLDSEGELEAVENKLFGNHLDESGDCVSCLERRHRLASVRSHFMLCYQSAVPASKISRASFFFPGSGASAKPGSFKSATIPATSSADIGALSNASTTSSNSSSSTFRLTDWLPWS